MGGVTFRSHPGGTSRPHWATGMDQLFAGLRYVALFSGLEMPAASVVNDALATIAAAGPHTRVGLTPRPGRHRWRYAPDVAVPVHQLPVTVVNGGAAAILEHVRRRRNHGQLEVHVSQRHIAFDINHGLGDGSLALQLVAAIFALSGGGTSPWVTEDDTTLALPRALSHTFANPVRVRQLWRQAARLRSAGANGLVPADVESVPWSPSPAVVVAHVDADEAAGVNEWRRVQAATSGSAAVWLFLVRKALLASGLPMTERIMVAFDCRRYLPKRRTVNSNFIFGIHMPLAIDDRLPSVAARLHELTAAAVPLAAVGAVSARALLSPAGPRPTVPTVRLGDAPADVMYTDMGNITPMVDGVPWRRDGERYATALIDPAGPDSVTVLNSRLGTTRSVAMSFHDNVFDRRVMERAAQYLRHPLGLLDDEVCHPR